MSKTVGQKLRQAREARSLTLEQVSEAIRIRPLYLQALESGEPEKLPSAVQARGFLRAYADFLGLDTQALLSPTSEADAEANETALSSVPGDSTPAEETQSRQTPITDSSPAGVADLIFVDIGQKLSRQRQLLGLTLDDVERHTHLRQHYLNALESGDLAALPSPVQARGMLNNYAAFLGIDTDPLLLQFADGLQAQLAARQSGNESNAPRSQKEPVRYTSSRQSSPWRRFFSGDTLVGLILAISLVTFVLWGAIRIFSLRSTQEPTATAPSIADVLLATATPTTTFTPLPTTPAPQSTQATAAALVGAGTPTGISLIPVTPGKTTVQLYLTVDQRAWMSVLVDGKLEFEGRVIPGSAYSFIGENQIEIVTGNAAALQVYYNGIDLGRLGLYGQVVNRIYGPNGVITATPSVTPTATSTTAGVENLTLTPAATLPAAPGSPTPTPPPLP